MKTFVGKILNIVGFIGIAIVSIFVLVSLILNFVEGVLFVGNLKDFLLNPTAIYYLIPLVLFSIGFIYKILLVIYNTFCLIKNKRGSNMFFFTLILLIFIILEIVIDVYLRYNVQGIEQPGIEISFLYWCGGINIFFSLISLFGNVLNFKGTN